MDPLTAAQPQQTQPVQPTQPQPVSAPEPVAAQPQPAPQQPAVAQPQAAQPAPGQDPQMPQLNDQFLQEVGLGVLPDAERQGMLEQMRKTLETNVGMEIYKNLQEHQLAEFEGFMPLNDENGQVITSEETANTNAQNWLNTNVPTWKTNPALQPYLNNPQAITNFAAMNWLQKNFPAYRNVVAAELNKLMTEVRNNVQQIIEAVMGPQNLNQNLQQAAPAQPQMQAPAAPAYDPSQQPPVAPVA